MLGPHMQMKLRPSGYPSPKAEVPEMHLQHSWSIAQMSYDDVKSPNSYNTFNTILYEAAFPADYLNTLERLKNQAHQAIRALEA